MISKKFKLIIGLVVVFGLVIGIFLWWGGEYKKENVPGKWSGSYAITAPAECRNTGAWLAEINKSRSDFSGTVFVNEKSAPVAITLNDWKIIYGEKILAGRLKFSFSGKQVAGDFEGPLCDETFAPVKIKGYFVGKKSE